MKKIAITSLIITALFIFGCSPSKDKLISQISDIEKNLISAQNPVPDKEKVKEIIELYEKYVKSFPSDTLSPVYLYKAAELSMNTGQSDEAIKYYDRIIAEYYEFEKLPECYFLKAFVYENYLKNINLAREAYNEFIKKYPNHELTDDAILSLGNLGKTPEQIIMEFEQKNREQADSSATVKK